MMQAFQHFPWDNGFVFKDGNTKMFLIDEENIISLNRGTSFVFVWEGFALASGRFGSMMLQPGMYGCFTEGTLRTYRGTRIIWIRSDGGYIGMFQVGGPLEREGRLKYIDGCTDSILIPPVKKGDPCLNHLHFPVGIRQTMHTHPEVRLGMVVKGMGYCTTEDGEKALVPGVVFAILPDGKHAFRTEKHTLDVIAWHPTTDVGPTDENHPMINRTIVEGVSASNLKAIQTA